MERARTRKRAEMIQGTLDMLILRTLDRNGSPIHGYGIAQHIHRLSREALRVEEGSLYPALQRLAINGWVKGDWGVSDKNHRVRFYTLTPAGRKQLQREVDDFETVLEAMRRVLQPA